MAINIMKHAIAAGLLCCATAAHAQVQTYTTLPPLYDGSVTTYGTNGWSATTTPMWGGGSTTTVIEPTPLLPTLPFQTQPVPFQPLATPSPWGYR